MKKIQLFFMNAMIMTATSLLMSSVSVWFNLYISNKIGAEGMGVFQLIMSVYSFAVTLGTSGIYLAATRLVAEETASPQGSAKGAMRRCLLYGVVFGSLAATVLFFGAPFIGEHWLRNAQTIRPLKTMALSMPFIAMSSAMGGYFTAVRRVAKSAASQMLEQFLKITLTMIGLTFLVPDGLEYACLAITGSGVIAEILSFVCIFVLYLFDSHRFRNPNSKARNLTKRLLGIALPVAVSSYLRSGLSTIKNLLVPIRLQAGGLSSSSSYAVFGTVQGIALPVILFPAAFLNSFSSLIVPEIAQYHSQKRDVSHMVERMFQLNMCVSFGICGILFCFAPEIGAAVSNNPDVGIYIRLLAPIIPVMYLDTAVDCMLKGMDEQLSVMRYNVMDAFGSMVLVYFLLPVLGIKGYILVICLSEIFNFALSLNRLISVTKFKLDLTERIVKPVLCIAIATLAVHSLFKAGALPNSSLLLAAASTVCLTGACYLILMLFAGYFKSANK